MVVLDLEKSRVKSLLSIDVIALFHEWPMAKSLWGRRSFPMRQASRRTLSLSEALL